MRWYRWNGLEQYTWAQNKSQLLFKFGVAGLVTGRGGRRGRLRKRWGWGGGHGAVLESPFNSCWEVRPFLPRGNKCIWGAKEKPWSQKAWASALLKEPAFGEPHPVPAMDREGQAENPNTWPWTQALWGRYGPAASLLWVCAFNWERFFQWLNTMREFRCLLLSTQHKSIGSILTGAFPHVPQIVLECNSFRVLILPPWANLAKASSSLRSLVWPDAPLCASTYPTWNHTLGERFSTAVPPAAGGVLWHRQHSTPTTVILIWFDEICQLALLWGKRDDRLHKLCRNVECF